LFLSAAPPEAVLLLGEQDVEAREASVAAGDVALELDLLVRRQARGVDLLLEYAEPVAQHDDLVEKGLDRPDLLLKAGLARAQHQVSAAPPVGGDRWPEPHLLAKDAPQHRLEIHAPALSRLLAHGSVSPFALAHEREGLVRPLDAGSPTDRRSGGRPGPGSPGAAPISGNRADDPRGSPSAPGPGPGCPLAPPVGVLASAVAADDPHGRPFGARGEHRVSAQGLARAAVILETISSAVPARRFVAHGPGW